MTETIEAPKSKKLKGAKIVCTITVNSKELLAACNVVSKAIDERSIVPALKNILITVEAGKISLTGSNLRQTVITTLEHSDLFASAKLAFPAHIGIRLLKSLPDTSIEISQVIKKNDTGTLNPEVHAVEINSNGNFYTLESEDSKDFVTAKQVDQTELITLPTDEVFRGLMYSKGISSTDNLKPALTGIYFGIKNSDFIVVATNGFSIVRYVARLTESVDTEFDFILPSSAALLLEDLTGEEVQIKLFKNGVEFSDSKTSVFAILIDAKYPDVDAYIPTEHKTEVSLELTSLKSALNRALVFNNPNTKNYFDISENGLQLNTLNKDINNDSQELIPVDDFSGSAYQFGFDPVYLMKLTSKINTGIITLKGTESMRPLMFFSSVEPGLAFLLMPCKLPE